MRRPFHAMPPNCVRINPHGRLHESIRALSGITMTARRPTTLQLSCERTDEQLLDATTEDDISLRFNELFPQRSTASFAGQPAPHFHHALSSR
jgi:hypothetical protein